MFIEDRGVIVSTGSIQEAPLVIKIRAAQQREFSVVRQRVSSPFAPPTKDKVLMLRIKHKCTDSLSNPELHMQIPHADFVDVVM